MYLRREYFLSFWIYVKSVAFFDRYDYDEEIIFFLLLQNEKYISLSDVRYVMYYILHDE